MPAETAGVQDIRPWVNQTLAEALRQHASDIHLEPLSDGYEIRFRIDGLLETVRKLDVISGRAFVTRLMVMGRLLTYRMDIPQEGHVSAELSDAAPIDLRLAVMPTVHGMRAAIRMPADHIQSAVLQELALPEPVLRGLRRFASGDSGMLILTGPAGSGKTTTIYALLRHIVESRSGLSIISLEDPVERHLSGVTQIEVSPFGQLTYEKALRSILRHDPQILVLGEIRDAATASLAVQAALSGHRLITTLHAATPAGAIARLLEMGIEPYQISSSVFGVVSQRLCRRKGADGTYRGRIPLAEFVEMDERVRQAVLQRSDADQIQQAYRGQGGYEGLATAAQALVRQGITDENEIARVLGNSAI